VNFNSLAAAGKILQLTLGIPALGPKVNYPLYGAYFQDDWKPTPKLTLNLGVRWDVQWNSMVQEVNGQRYMGTFSIPGVYDRSTRKRDLDNVAPRFGFAYDVGGHGLTVVRGNVGVFYAQLPNLPLYFEQLYQDGANTNAVTIRAPRLTNWLNPTAEVGNPKQYISAKPTTTLDGNDLQNPVGYQFGLGFSRQISPGFGLDVDVVRLQGRHEILPRNLNLPDPVTGRFLVPTYGVVTINETDGRSLYNALLVKLQKRMSHKLQFLASYTLSKADNTSSSIYTSAADSFQLGNEYGPAAADRRHRFVLSGVTTALPYDLQFSGVLSLSSSRPFDVLAGQDLNKDGDFSDRPPGVTRDQGCRNLDLTAVNAFRQLNGIAPVTSVDCQGHVSLDVRLSKAIRFSSARRLELFFEVFNLTNANNLEHAQGQAIQVDRALSSTFGQAIIAGYPRQAQLAARFLF
jgi:hypothetical protein